MESWIGYQSFDAATDPEKGNVPMTRWIQSKYKTNRRLGMDRWGRAKSSVGARRGSAAANSEVAITKSPRKVFGTLIMPNGQQIRTMREDAFQAALAATRATTP